MFFLSFSSEMTVFIIDYETSILLQQAIAGRCRPVCSAGQGLLEAHGICGCLCTQTSANRGCGNCQAPLRLLGQYFRTEKAWIFWVLKLHEYIGVFYQHCTSLILMCVLGVSGYKEKKNTIFFGVFWPVCHHLLNIEKFNYRYVTIWYVTALNIKLLLKQKSA